MEQKKRTKLLLMVTLFGMFLIGCIPESSSNDPVSKANLVQKADQFLNQWHQAASEADYEAYFRHMDSLSVFIGTDYTENWTKTEFKAFSKPYFDDGQAWDFKAIDRNIYSNATGSILWFDELLQTWMGICRGSGVIENKEGQLHLKHYVLSVTIPNQDVSEFLKLKPQELDSTFIQNLSLK